MAMARGFANLGGLALLGVLVALAAQNWPHLEPGAPKPKASATQPDYLIEDLHAIDLDEQGRLRYELTAARLLHYPRPERAQLHEPDLVFYRNPGEDGEDAVLEKPWRMTARSGELTNAGNRLRLAGDVNVQRETDVEAEQVELQTPWLLVFRRTETASTEAPVHMRTALARMDSVGMDVDMRSGQVQLHSQVRGQYDPP